MSRFTSRKFLLAASTAAAALATGNAPAAVAIVIAYLGAEGVIDVKALRAARVEVDEFADEVESELDAQDV